MHKIAAVISVVLFVSCSSPRYRYYFMPSEAQKTNSSILPGNTGAGIMNRNELLTASREQVMLDSRTVSIDTGIISSDSVPRQKSKLQSDSTSKEVKKRMYLEKKKAYLEAKKASAAAYASTKDKRKNLFTVAGAILFLAAFICLFSYPWVAAGLGTLALVASILGLKSKVWGLSLAVLIAIGVVLNVVMIFVIAYA